MTAVMSMRELIALLLFCTAMTFSPGPNTMLTTAIASNEGIRKALPFTLAVPLGWLLIMLVCGFGIGALVTQLPPLRWLIKLVGCFYLLYLAFILSSLGKVREIEPARLKMGFIKGIALQFLNIKVWLLAVTVTSAWIIHAEGQISSNPQARLILASLIVMFFAFISNFSYAILGAIARNWLLEGSRLLVFNRILASMLAATAMWTLLI